MAQPSPALALACLIGLSWLMFAAGIGKLRHREHHARALDAYEILPPGAGRWLALPLAALECVLGALLWIPALRVAAAAVLLALLLVYTAAIGIALLHGRRDIDCGCGASRRHLPPSGWLVARNTLLMLATLPLPDAPAGATAREWAWALAIAGVAAIAYNALHLLLSREALLQDD